MLFVAGKSIIVYLRLISALWTITNTHANLLELGQSQDISDISEIEEANLSTTELSFLSYIRPPRAATRSCSAPPQPENGEWRLHPNVCDESSGDCKVPEGTELGLGYQLIYSCRAGYKISGNEIVFCITKGDWSPLPVCKEIRCDPLNTVSRIGICHHSVNRVDCDLPVLPKTWAEASCRPGYTRDTTVFTQRRNMLNCNEDGNWEPQPIRCIPVCGQVATHHKPFAINGWNANIGDFPWHATLYLENKARKEFICGATIIQANLLMTAAHCVYDERLRVEEDPGNLFVMTGNTLRDYDHPDHNPDIVKKAAVKQVYTYYSYYGLRGNYASDIALLELHEPFVFSEILLPACLDTSGFSAPILEPGASGKVAGFGITATGESSPILQTITVPYISHAECKVSKNAAKNDVFITKDKFCAGYTNGTAVCEGDSGGGLVFPKNDHWYVMGIVSVGLGVNIDNGAKTCEKYAYTLYTRVSDYADWIFEVISTSERRKFHSLSNPNLGSSTSTTPKPTSSSSAIETHSVISAQNKSASDRFCFVPPPPTDGDWVREPLCNNSELNNVECNASIGMRIEPGKSLIYHCNGGYYTEGNTTILCSNNGTWTGSPMCTGCGKGTRSQSPLNGVQPDVGELPWHATVYKKKRNSKDRLCGATIIRQNFLTTAAHCVYDGITSTVRDVKNLFVATGNIHLEYDSPLHNTEVVKKSAVEKIYVPETYSGRIGNYASDIALLELKEPFEFSSTLSPACLSLDFGDSIFLKSGAFGKGVKSKVTAASESRSTLTTTTTTVPYLTYSQCKQMIDGRYFVFISKDKFCTGSTNGTGLCAGDEGNGLVFKKNDRWYLMGIASVGVGFTPYEGLRACSSVNLYTKVSSHADWIMSVISR